MDAPDAMVLAGGLVGAAGLVGLAIGIGFGVQAQDKQTESESYCQPPDYLLCTQQGLDLLDESATASTVANVGLVAGGLLAATGLVLVIVGAASDDAGDETEQARITWAFAPLASMNGGGLHVRATW